MTTELSGKVALVTGGSAGIGLAQHAGDPANGIVEAGRGEGSAVGAFVHRREHRHQCRAMEQHGRDEQIPIRQHQPHQRAGCRDAVEMDRTAQRALQIRALPHDAQVDDAHYKIVAVARLGENSRPWR